MAKKKAVPKGPPHQTIFRMNPSQRQCLEAMAKKLDVTNTDAIKKGLALLAEKLGMEWPPTRA